MPHRGIATILCALFACACGGPAKRLEQARDMALAGHKRAALLEAKALLFSIGSRRDPKTDPARRGALKLAGDLCALHLDDPRCAANQYRELVRAYPTAPESFEARERLGDLDLRLGDPRAAIEAWRDQVAAGPKRPGADAALLKVARALVDLADYAGARLAASELQARWPGSPLGPKAALLAASTFHLAASHAEAVVAYRGVAEQHRGSPEGADALFEMGNCLVEQGEDEKAMPAFTAALRLHKEPELVQFALERSQRRLALVRAVDPKDRAAVWDRIAQRAQK